MKMEIKSWLTGNVLFPHSAEGDNCYAENIKELLMSAIKAGANLSRADLYGTDLRGANLRGADLYGANLRGADLYEANLRGANLREADLYGANLHGTDLRWANLHGANLRGTDLRGANLHGANLRGANLRGADLYGADLYGADLYGANLRGADLREADLYGTDLRRANLYGANFDSKYCYLSISSIGSENGCLWTFRGEDGVLKLNRGCFSGTLPEFVEAVKNKHSGNKYEKQYMAAIELIKTVLMVDDNGKKKEE